MGTVNPNYESDFGYIDNSSHNNGISNDTNQRSEEVQILGSGDKPQEKEQRNKPVPGYHNNNENLEEPGASTYFCDEIIPIPESESTVSILKKTKTRYMHRWNHSFSNYNIFTIFCYRRLVSKSYGLSQGLGF